MITPTSLLYPDAFLSPLAIDEAVHRALDEDLGRAGDITSLATIPEATKAQAVLVARQSGVIAGLPLALATLQKLSPDIEVRAHVGVIRERDGLADAVRNFAALEHAATSITVRNMATTALLVAAAAWSRCESRGAHFRSDHAAEVPALAQRTMTTLTAAREIADGLTDHSTPRIAQSMIA